MSIQQNKRQRGRPSKYPPEFRRDAVGLVFDEGRTIADVARSLGAVGEGTLGNWVKKNVSQRVSVRVGASMDTLSWLSCVRGAKLWMKGEPLRRSLALSIQRDVDTVTRYECVDDQKAAGFLVTTACEAAEVSTSGFYDWKAREAAGPTQRELEEAPSASGAVRPHSRGHGP